MAKQKAQGAAQAKAVSRHPGGVRKVRVSKKNGAHFKRQHRLPVDLDMMISSSKVQEQPKYKSEFIKVPNLDKKEKKLEYRMTKSQDPPPGFSFIPVGNPELSNACKEISREKEYLIFVVTSGQETTEHIADHVKRLGYHFRSTVVEEAATLLGGADAVKGNNGSRRETNVDIIPEKQEDIDRQADAALRDLFPRIPTLDREQIIAHAFQKGAKFNGDLVVGMQKDLTLSRRVQLAANAHIRHTHTDYDKLLKQTDWATARRLVEPKCLDIIMKWRGDEETGRDQLDEILREVVIIDSEDDEEAPEVVPEDIANASDEERQFLRQVAVSRQSPDYTPLRRPMNGLSHGGSQRFKRRLHPDDPEYAEQQNQSSQKRFGGQHRNRPKKQSKQEKEERKGYARWAAYQEAEERQNARRKQLDGNNDVSNNENQAGYAGRDDSYGQRQGQQIYASEQNRQPMTHYDQNRGHQSQLVLGQEHIPTSRPFSRPLNQVSMLNHERHMHDNHSVTAPGVPPQRRETDRPIQYDQQNPISPIRRPRFIGDIENIDLTDSPKKNDSPLREERFSNNMPPRRVLTVTQPAYHERVVDQHDHLPLHPRNSSTQNNGDAIGDGDHSTGSFCMHRRNTSLNQVMSRDPPMVHLRTQLRQEPQSFSSNRVHIPPSQHDTSWVPEPYQPRETIIVTSSPYSESHPAHAPTRRLVGPDERERMYARSGASEYTSQFPKDRGESRAVPSRFNQTLHDEQPVQPMMQHMVQSTQDLLPMDVDEGNNRTQTIDRAQPRYIEQFDQPIRRISEYDGQSPMSRNDPRLIPVEHSHQGLRVYRMVQPEPEPEPDSPVIFVSSQFRLGAAQRPITFDDNLPIYNEQGMFLGHPQERVVYTRAVYSDERPARGDRRPIYTDERQVYSEQVQWR